LEISLSPSDPFGSWQDVVRFKAKDPSVRRVRWFWNDNNNNKKKKSRSQRRKRRRRFRRNDSLEEGMISSTNNDASHGDSSKPVETWNDIEGIELWELPQR
jgi:hypothetical protein